MPQLFPFSACHELTLINQGASEVGSDLALIAITFPLDRARYLFLPCILKNAPRTCLQQRKNRGRWESWKLTLNNCKVWLIWIMLNLISTRIFLGDHSINLVSLVNTEQPKLASQVGKKGTFCIWLECRQKEVFIFINNKNYFQSTWNCQYIIPPYVRGNLYCRNFLQPNLGCFFTCCIRIIAYCVQ